MLYENTTGLYKNQQKKHVIQTCFLKYFNRTGQNPVL